MKCRFIASEKAHHALTLLCRCLRITRSGFYAWQRRPESARAKGDRQMKLLVHASFAASKGRYGSPRIHEDLDQGCTCTSEDYQQILDARDITGSMSRRGDCYDNAVMESFCPPNRIRPSVLPVMSVLSVFSVADLCVADLSVVSVACVARLG
jgi:hypothetical protein